MARPDSELTDIINGNVRELMRLNDVSQQYLCYVLGWYKGRLDRHLSGEAHWRADEIDAVAKAFGIPVSEFVKPMERGD